MADRWSYKLIRVNLASYPEDQAEIALDAFGAQGWEAVGIAHLSVDGWIRVLFKKKTPPAEASGAK